MVPSNLCVLPHICSSQFATSLIGTLPCCLLTPLSQSLTQDIFFYRLPAALPLLFLFSCLKHLTITADTSFLNSFDSPITAVFQGLQLSSDSHHLLVPHFSLSIAHLLTFFFPMLLKNMPHAFFPVWHLCPRPLQCPSLWEAECRFCSGSPIFIRSGD